MPRKKPLTTGQKVAKKLPKIHKQAKRGAKRLARMLGITPSKKRKKGGK